MAIDFQINGIEFSKVSAFLELNDAELKHHQAIWVNADSKPGYPCRVSLQEADVGERVLLLPYIHHNVNSPYRASGPIFVKENAQQSTLSINEIPEVLTHRLLSVRAYSQSHMMLHAETVQGLELAKLIQHNFLNSDIAYIHIHNAKPGCFSCSVYRA